MCVFVALMVCLMSSINIQWGIVTFPRLLRVYTDISRPRELLLWSGRER